LTGRAGARRSAVLPRGRVPARGGKYARARRREGGQRASSLSRDIRPRAPGSNATVSLQFRIRVPGERYMPLGDRPVKPSCEFHAIASNLLGCE